MDEAIAQLEIASISANESEALKSIGDERKAYWDLLFAKYSACDENASEEEFEVEAEEEWTNVPRLEDPIPMPNKCFRKFVRQTTQHFDFQSQITLATGIEEDMINDSFSEGEDSDDEDEGDLDKDQEIGETDQEVVGQEESESDDDDDDNVFHHAQSDSESVDEQAYPAVAAFAFRDEIETSPSLRKTFRLASASPCSKAAAPTETDRAADGKAPFSSEVKDEFAEEEEDEEEDEAEDLKPAGGDQDMELVFEEKVFNFLDCFFCGASTELPEIYWQSSDVPFECNRCLRLSRAHEHSQAHSDGECATCKSLAEVFNERLIVEESFRNGTLAIQEELQE